MSMPSNSSSIPEPSEAGSNASSRSQNTALSIEPPAVIDVYGPEFDVLHGHDVKSLRKQAAQADRMISGIKDEVLSLREDAKVKTILIERMVAENRDTCNEVNRLKGMLTMLTRLLPAFPTQPDFAAPVDDQGGPSAHAAGSSDI